MKIHINKQFEARLLNAIREGVFDTDKFPEIRKLIIDWDESLITAEASKWDISSTDWDVDVLGEEQM